MYSHIKFSKNLNKKKQGLGLDLQFIVKATRVGQQTLAICLGLFPSTRVSISYTWIVWAALDLNLHGQHCACGAISAFPILFFTFCHFKLVRRNNVETTLQD